MRWFPLLIILLFGACRHGETLPPEAPPPRPSVKPAAPLPSRPPLGTLFREDVDSGLSAGLGRFLQHVQVEPALDEGRFLGWEILELNPPAFWRGIDLFPGDVVTRVNGLPIEREFEAYTAFISLKNASELRVNLERGGEPRELVLKIVPRVGGGAKPELSPRKPEPSPRKPEP